PAAHIISKWPDDAMKVIGKKPLEPGKWHYVSVAYDASGKAGGVKLYVDGGLQEVEVAADTLKNPIRTAVPFKLAQRNSDSRVAALVRQDLRIYSRALAPDEVVKLAGATRALYLLAKPAEGRDPTEVQELYAWWLKTFDAPFLARTAEKQ